VLGRTCLVPNGSVSGLELLSVEVGLCPSVAFLAVCYRFLAVFCWFLAVFCRFTEELLHAQ